MRVTGGRDAWFSGRGGTDLKGAIAVRRVRVGGRGVVVFVYVRLVIHGRPLTASSHCGPRYLDQQRSRARTEACTYGNKGMFRFKGASSGLLEAVGSTECKVSSTRHRLKKTHRSDRRPAPTPANTQTQNQPGR
jgi:hypothetical protein